MHSTLSRLNCPAQAKVRPTPFQAKTARVGNAARRWLRMALRQWQRRKMIASFEAMDDRLLSDIGICRSDIHRMVQGFDARELRMVPLAPSATLPPPATAAPVVEGVFMKAA